MRWRVLGIGGRGQSRFPGTRCEDCSAGRGWREHAARGILPGGGACAVTAASIDSVVVTGRQPSGDLVSRFVPLKELENLVRLLSESQGVEDDVGGLVLRL